MRERLRKYWPALKLVLAVAILLAVGRRFKHDLESNPDLWKLSLRPGWLALASGLYIIGMLFPMTYWYRLLWKVGERPGFRGCVRAYFLAQLGKYLPGKAWALVIRAAIVGEAGVKPSMSAITSFYEVLVNMASGVLLAAILFAIFGPTTDVPIDWHALRDLILLRTPTKPVDRIILVALSLMVAALVSWPIIPPVFNMLAHRLSLPFRDAAAPLAPIGYGTLLEGLTLTCFCWIFFGASFVAAIEAVLPPDQAFSFSPASVARLIAMLALAYVAGFVIVVVPSGLGVREFFLTLLLAPELSQRLDDPSEARALAVLIVLLLRLIWTGTEAIVSGAVYWLPYRR